MKFIIPCNEELDLETIQLKFMLKYYPEMPALDGGKLFYFFGPEYVALEKNTFVHGIFTVKQKGDKTIVKTQRGQSRWLGLPFVNYFVAGDFYDDVNLNFKKFLIQRYGYKEEEIVTKTSWWEKLSKFSKFFLVWLSFVFATLLLRIVLEEFGWIYTRTSFVLLFGLFVITILLTIFLVISFIWKVINYMRK